MRESWLLLPSGDLVALSDAQALLIDTAATTADLEVIAEDLRRVLDQSQQVRAEASRLMTVSRRQRLRLRLVPKTSE